MSEPVARGAVPAASDAPDPPDEPPGLKARFQGLCVTPQRLEWVKGAQLNETDAKRVLQHLADLWSYDVSLAEIDTTGTVLKEYVANPRELAAAAA